LFLYEIRTECYFSFQCGTGFCDFQIGEGLGYCGACETACADQGLNAEGLFNCQSVCEEEPETPTEAPEDTAAPVVECSSSAQCGAGGFCNFDNIISGFCESCSDIVDCVSAELDTTEGSASCIAACEAFQNTNADFVDSDSGYSMDGFVLQLFANTPCDLISDACASATSNSCQYAYCREFDNRCFVQAHEIGYHCTVTQVSDENNIEREIPGLCVDGICVWNDSAECPDGTLTAERTFPSCGNQNFHRTFRFQGQQCPQTGSTCDDFGPVVNNLICWTSSTKDEFKFDVHYHDPNDVNVERDGHDFGKCIIGEQEDCVIQSPGTYSYRGMDITWGTGENSNEYTTTLTIPLTQKIMAPYLHCPDGEWCRGTVSCQMNAAEPCGRTAISCDGTASPTVEPTKTPTVNPTLIEVPSSHGDPIIWTFNGDCYDLNKDGLYLATSHPQINHDVYIAVYNDYMREIQIQDKSGEILLSVNNLGDVINNWPYRFSEELKKCHVGEETTCNLFFTEYTFDAQQFKYIVQTLPHDYHDPALKEGEQGIHLDIFPRPYEGFQQHKGEYNGLYFANPLPQQLEFCPDGSQRHREGI